MFRSLSALTMVLIVIGAIQAAKVAKAEYEKDKKRRAMIVPVEGSAGLMADRHGTSVGGADTWFGNPRTQPRSGQEDMSVAPAHAGIGAWSRSTPTLESELMHAPTMSVEDYAQQPQTGSDSELEAQKVLIFEGMGEKVSNEEGNVEIFVKEEEQVNKGRQMKRESRKHKSRQSTPIPGSFEAMLQAKKTEEMVDGGESSLKTLKDNKTMILLSEEQDATLKTRDEVEGSFAAAMRKGERALQQKEWGRERALAALERKRSVSVQGADILADNNAAGKSKKGERRRTEAESVRQVGARRVVDGSFTAAMQNEGRIKKKSSRASDKASAGTSSTSVHVEGAKPRGAGVNTSVEKEDTDGSFVSAMRRDSRRRPEATKEGKNASQGGLSITAGVNTASSEARPVRRMKEAKENDEVQSSSFEARSSMSAQGTTRKRVVRRL